MGILSKYKEEDGRMKTYPYIMGITIAMVIMCIGSIDSILTSDLPLLMNIGFSSSIVILVALSIKLSIDSYKLDKKREEE